MVNKTNAKRIVIKLIKELEKNNIPINKSYVFGSIANGTAKTHSDIDVALISKSFSGFKYEDRKKINPFILKINTNIEAHPFTIKEFSSNNPLVKEILKTGIKIL